MAKVDIQTLAREIKELREGYPYWSLDNAFVHWFIHAFLTQDADVAAQSVTGVSRDKGIDAVFVDENVKKVCILQGKFHQGAVAKNEPRGEVIAFAQIARQMFGSKEELDKLVTGMDPSLAQKLELARGRLKRTYSLNLYYVTTNKVSSLLKSEAESELREVRGDASISVLDRSDVLSLLVDYLGGAAPPVPFLDLPIDARDTPGSESVIQRYDQEHRIESWIFSMSGAELAKAYRKAGDRIFARNIRGFLGDTAINEGMAQTLESDAASFWYFNNGVTIVCDSARKTSERGEAIVRVTNPQIINGQQTTRTLSEHPQSRAAVLVRVFSVPRDNKRTQAEFETLVSNIVAATNWQNAILHSDLRANDTRQVALERDMAKLKYHYLRKRQTKREARRLLGGQRWFMIKKDELAQVVGACELDPYIVRSGKEGLFKAPYYDQIFNNRAVAEHLTIYWLGRAVKYCGSGYPDRAYAKWHVLHYLWRQVGPILRPRANATAFRHEAERNRWPQSLITLTNQIYDSHMAYYRANRGTGNEAIDVSNFFYKPHKELGFSKFASSNKNTRRAKIANATMRFRRDIEAAVEG